MNPKRIKEALIFILPATVSTILMGGLFAYAYVRFTERIEILSGEVNQLNVELASTTMALFGRTDNLAEDILRLGQKAAGLSSTLSVTEKNLEATKKNIETVQTRVGGVEGTVSTLEKLSKTDPELLQKYSKIFFLNEHYVPERMVVVDEAYAYSVRTPISIHVSVWPHLKELVDAAKKEGVTIYIKSGYRSFKQQSAISSAYSVIYGAGTANQFSAEQGYSEHQLGTTVDLITTGLGGELDGFDKTSAYPWLLDNAHKYGFTLSYYKGNTYYIFEPWHWRYVGVALATYLHRENKHFYNLDQREIDTYLANIFD